ncbi:MAG: TlpA family protein disulfide reductase [Candidatus Marinimicrobia bacterium]|nr:TlpA family protein disulfide reductase [Candidatus Neomarinimicrobiota bacterium]
MKLKNSVTMVILFSTFMLISFGVGCAQKEQKPNTTSEKNTGEIKEPQSMRIPGSIGSIAPDFSLITLDGKEVTLKQFKDKVVILNFWASWCSPCLYEIPDFIKMYDKHKKDGLEIVGITLSSGNATKIRSFVKDNSINYTILTGDEKYLKDLTVKYGGIRGIPTTFLIDRKSVIQKKWVGARTEKVFMAAVEKYL